MAKGRLIHFDEITDEALVKIADGRSGKKSVRKLVLDIISGDDRVKEVVNSIRVERGLLVFPDLNPWLVKNAPPMSDFFRVSDGNDKNVVTDTLDLPG